VILLDTGGLLANFDRSARYHGEVASILARLQPRLLPHLSWPSSATFSATLRGRSSSNSCCGYITSQEYVPLLLRGDALSVLRSLPASCIDCATTSPPYWGNREYAGGGIGREDRPRDFVSALRNTVIWNKVKGGPDNSADELRNIYEPVFHFVKSQRGYYYDVDSIRATARKAKVSNGSIVSATGVSGVRYK
jgi:hypothetical protein